MQNLYFKDASGIFKRISRAIVNNNPQDQDEKNAEWEVINNSLLFAIGIEKLLKSILSDINPLYILENPDFKNSAPILYKDLIENPDKTTITDKPNPNVISLQNSILRTAIFSYTVLKNKNTLMQLKVARDIIAHNNLKELNIEEARSLLFRDYYPLLNNLADEHGFNAKAHFFNNMDSQLAHISSQLQDDIEKKIELQIESAQSRWKTLENTSTYKKYKSEIETVNCLENEFVFPTKCPSCENQAVLFTAPVMEYDIHESKMKTTGFDVKSLQCKFCGLEVSDYKALDRLSITPDIDGKDKVIEAYSSGRTKES